MRFAVFIVLFLSLVSTTGFAQKRDRDFDIPADRSLENLRKLPDDSTKVKIINYIGWDTAYYNLALGLDYGYEALAVAKRINFRRGLMMAYNTIGATYGDMGKFDEALEAHMNGLRVAEEMNDSRRIGTSCMNISLVYNSMHDTANSVKFLLRAVESYEKINYTTGLAVAYLNLGAQYYELRRLTEASSTLRKSLAISNDLNLPKTAAHAYGGIALILSDSGRTAEAHDYMNKAFAVMDTLDDPYEEAKVKSSAAAIFISEKNYPKAIELYYYALNVMRSIGVREELVTIYRDLSEVYEMAGQPDSALTAWRNYIALQDSLVNEDVLEHQRNLEAMYESEKKEQEIELLTRKGSVRQYFLLAIIACSVVVLFLVIMLYKRNQFRKQTNIETERRNSEIETINRNITDSINYASRIQEAVIPSVDQLKNEFKDAFVLSRPKDIVSGDFWWCTKQNDAFFLAVADSTGHGVPGGFMSMLGSVFLFETINEKSVTSPALILDQLRLKIISALSKSGINTGMKDGMDMVMCRFHSGNRKMDFACAMNPVWIIRNNSVIEFRADKYPVGEYHGEMKNFNEQSFDLEAGDMVYLFSDGYADQFGGPAGKKMKYRALRDILLEAASLSCTEQRNVLNSKFDEWKGALEQVDDVIITGIRI